MSKYIKLEEAIHNINLEVTGRKEYTGDMKANLFFALDDLPIIEVSEDCIERDLIINQLLNLMSVEKEHYEGMDKALKLIEHAPSVVPTTEQSSKVGEWIDTGSGQECSVCGEIQYGYDSMRKFCANCGAKMKGAEEE